jgi:glycosyltransferase involved in cell wall biosynthesis
MTHVARVTVGVPAYNEASYLEAQLEYLRTQDFPDIEVLIYDNASTDATPEIARRFCDVDPRFRYFRQPENKGPQANFNDVLQAARSPYFMWRACDDRSDKNYIAELVRVLDEHPEAELAVSPVITVDLEGVELKKSAPLEKCTGKPKSDIERAQQLFSYHISVVYGLYRRQLLVDRWRTVMAEYDVPWGSDHFLLFAYVFNGQLAGSKATRFEQVIKSTAASRAEARKRYNTKADVAAAMRRKFFAYGRRIVDEHVPSRARRLYWYGVLWLYIGNRLYKFRKLIRQRAWDLWAGAETR